VVTKRLEVEFVSGKNPLSLGEIQHTASRQSEVLLVGQCKGFES